MIPVRTLAPVLGLNFDITSLLYRNRINFYMRRHSPSHVKEL